MSVTTPVDEEEPQLAPGNTVLGDIWVNFKRWLVKNLRNSHTVGFALIQPVVFLVLFTEVFGQITGGVLTPTGGESISYTTFLLPAIVMQVSLLSASASGIWLVDDIENGMLGKTLVSPMRRGAVFLGKTLAEMVFTTAQIVLVLVAAILLGAEIETGVVGAVWIIGIGILFSIWFSALSNVFGLLSRDTEATVLVVNFFQLPLLFVSSAFLPVEILPGWIQFLSSINPVTYGVDATRALVVQGWAWDTILPALGVLVVIDLVFGTIGVYALNRTTSASTR
ncbi:MAG: ABC transporter permease [Halorhabdus sp.]